MEIGKAEKIRDYLKCAAIIGIPVVLQNIVSSLVNTLDVFMLGQLGEVAITASSMSNQWFMLFCILTNGIASAAAIFISQYWGKKDVVSIHHFMGIHLCIAVGLSAFFMIFASLAPERVMRLYSLDDEVIKEGIRYLKIISVTYLLYAVNSTLGTALRSIGQTKAPMVSTVISLLCNVAGNYLFIFGNFGFPRMGVAGAAISTVIARIIELSVLMLYIAIKKPPILGPAVEFFKVPVYYWKKFFHYGGLVILGEVVYAVGNNLYNVIYKYTGTQAQASIQIIQTIQNLALLFCGGFGTAAAVMIGNLLGESRFEKALKCSKILTAAAVIVSVISSGIIWVMGPAFLILFKMEVGAQDNLLIMLRILSLSIPLRTIVYMVFCGILRSGGDNLYCFFANLFGVWVIGLPLAFMAAVVWGLPVYMVYFMAVMEEAGKLLICGPRVLKKKWLNNLTN